MKRPPAKNFQDLIVWQKAHQFGGFIPLTAGQKRAILQETLIFFAASG
ncbi:MAG: hypothetical protein H8D67_23185 [Deltaproteobacteria bacterium]|nr:hypothetical protein [Deltaproteobacteria bacterium]MBL7204583.1 hypothetical protein [Desulfobacteraceae bacterium]